MPYSMLERDYLWLPSPGGSLSYPRTVLKVHVVIGMLQKSFLKTQFKERGGQEPHRIKEVVQDEPQRDLET